MLGQGAKLPQPRQASCTLVGHPPWPGCAAALQGQGWARSFPDGAEDTVPAVEGRGGGRAEAGL